MRIETVEATKIRVTFGMALRPFWAASWRGCLIMFAANITYVMAILVPYFLGLTQFHSVPQALQVLNKPLAFVATILGGFFISVVLMRIALFRRYRDFSIVPRSVATQEPIYPSMKQTFKLWWSWMWRICLLMFPVVLISIVIGVIAGILAEIVTTTNDHAQLVGLLTGILTFVATIWIYLKAYTIVMQKRYSDFYMTIDLHPAQPAA